jgi:adenine-specific DNA-methyltransferase
LAAKPSISTIPEQAGMSLIENEAAQKLRGGYYTSAEVARWLCAWAIRRESDTILEPSCGAGEFLAAAVRRYAQLGIKGPQLGSRLTGVEIVPGEAKSAINRLRADLGVHADSSVNNEDFFQWWQNTKSSFDAVVGNPPFIRYQVFPEPHRSRAMAIMQTLGLSPNRLTNVWVPFVVAAAATLRAGGRLGLVLPAELLQVSYAAQLRSFLADRFARIDIVACNELFFENAEQEVVLLLADGASPASETNVCRVAMTECATVAEITNQNPAALLRSAQPKTLCHDNEKWLKYFLTAHEITFMRELRQAENTTVMSTHAGVDVGVVTGKNEFFVLSAEQIELLGLRGHTVPLVSRSGQLKGSRLGKSEWKMLSAAGDRVHLLNISATTASELNQPLRRYIRFGEQKEYHKGYKCSIRKPWYTTPSAWVPDGFMFRQIYDFPRIVLNASGATSTDTIHRLTCKTDNPERVIANTYTWLTAASAEIEGRSYGGGVLELEPTEAERLLVPAKLNGAMRMSECDQLTRDGRLDDVLEENARVVLREHMGLSHTECHILRDIWIKMRDRRLSRKRRAVVRA